MYIICQHMHWDYWMYKAQPQEFKDIILNHMSAESAARKQRPRASGSEPTRAEFLAAISESDD